MLVVLFCGAAVFVITNYSWVFAKRVRGEIIDVQRVTNPTAILGRGATEEQIHSYAILIQGNDGKMYTSSSDDRQWQVARKGYCVDALFYVYPPWNLEKSGTYYNARLSQLMPCPGKLLPSRNPEPEAPAAQRQGAPAISVDGAEFR